MDNLLFSYADPTQPIVKQKLIQLIEVATGQRHLKRIYLEHRRSSTRESFWAAAVRRLALDVHYDRDALERIPKQGPLVVVANHPYGVLDGIVISWLMEQCRPDFLVLTHAALLRAPEARDYLLPVDFSGTPEALQTNIASRARAREHLDRGGCIVVFPAGAVSTAPDRLGRRRAVDAPWQPFAAQLIQRARATVVPIHFEGQNSRLFQIASHVSQTLRLSLIFHEVKNRIGTALPVIIGAPIPFADLYGITDRKVFAELLMSRTYGLARPEDGESRPNDKLRIRAQAAAARLRDLARRHERVRRIARKPSSLRIGSMRPSRSASEGDAGQPL